MSRKNSYWLVSVPYEESRSKTLKRLKQKMHTEGKMCDVFDFKLPQLKVGTLDELLTLSDDLQRYDATVEQVAQKVIRTLADLLREDSHKRRKDRGNISSGSSGSSGGGNEALSDFQPDIMLPEGNTVPVELYMSYFQWDENQYMVVRPLTEISDLINRKALKYDEELRVKTAEYSALKTAITSLERKKTGPLSVRPLDGLITQDMIVDTEYLTTLFVAVPKAQIKEWNSKYAELDGLEFIVPDSSELIAEDSDYSLFSVVMIRKIADDFKTACMKHKFIVRDFQYDKQRFELSQLELEGMEEKKEATRNDLFEWCKVGFSEVFSAWTHIKAVRVFVESILRYGLPARNVTVLLRVPYKNEKKVHRFLREEYKHLAGQHADVKEEDLIKAGGAAAYATGIDFYPYVLIAIQVSGFPLLKL